MTLFLTIEILSKRPIIYLGRYRMVAIHDLFVLWDAMAADFEQIAHWIGSQLLSVHLQKKVDNLGLQI